MDIILVILYNPDTIKGAREKQTQLTGLLKVGGFPLRKWAANIPEWEEWLPESHRLQDSSFLETHNTTI